MIFKDYDGNPVDVSDHVHILEDTQRNSVTALASVTEDGFMPKEYKAKLDTLVSKTSEMEEKIKDGVFLNSTT